MPFPRVVALVDDSPARRAGIAVGDEIVSVDGQVPRDVIQWQLLVDEPDPEIELSTGGLLRTILVSKRAGEPLGIEVDAAIFDRVQTCDNHCPFCFIYQLPKGMRRSLYLKDDDYRLSFLYGNFTTLTRFTEADLERVLTERLSPLYVSIHATDPQIRSEILRNRRGATSLRWLRLLLDEGIEVHGQIVVCPGINDGDVLDATLCGVLDEYSALTSVAVVPLGISRYSTESTMREHSTAEARRVLEIVSSWQRTFELVLGRLLVYAADEYYLLAGSEFPPASSYGAFEMHEDGIGMVRAFEAGFRSPGRGRAGTDVARSGFFKSVDGAPAAGYRAPRVTTGDGCGGQGPSPGAEYGGELPNDDDAFGSSGVDAIAAPEKPVPASVRVELGPRRGAAIGVITSSYGRDVVGPLVDSLDCSDVRMVTVDNEFFGGNIGVAGLMVGQDIARTLAEQPEGDRYLLPDVCLTGGRFLDGLTIDDLPRSVEVVSTDGASLRIALESR